MFASFSIRAVSQTLCSSFVICQNYGAAPRPAELNYHCPHYDYHSYIIIVHTMIVASGSLKVANYIIVNTLKSLPPSYKYVLNVYNGMYL